MLRTRSTKRIDGRTIARDEKAAPHGAAFFVGAVQCDPSGGGGTSVGGGAMGSGGSSTGGGTSGVSPGSGSAGAGGLPGGFGLPGCCACCGACIGIMPG